MSNTPTSTITNCQARAYAYLVELIGARPEKVTWDTTHCLRGHVRLGRHDLVVIATHDQSHEPVVLMASNWEAVRRSSDDERRELIEQCAITDHSGLVRLAA